MNRSTGHLGRLRVHRSAVAPGVIALALVTGCAALSLTACSSGEPAPPAPPATDSPISAAAPTADPAIEFTDVTLQSDTVEASGADIVLVRGDTRGMATLYSLAQQNPATIALDVEPGEAVEGVSWAVEQDQDAEPVAVALVYISTEASGLNATADKVQMRVYDDTGTELSRTDLPGDITGTPYEPGDLGGAKPSRYLTVADGTAVFSTELADDTYGLLGYDVTTSTEKWRAVGSEEPSDTGVSLANGWVALNWQDMLTTIDPATGDVKWTSDRAAMDNADGNAPYIITSKLSPSHVDRSTYSFLDADTGAPRAMPQDFNNYAVDPLTGQSSFYWNTLIGSDPASQPGILVRDTDNTDIFALDGEKKTAAGVHDILAMWNGYIWIETSAGRDIVAAATGNRAPGISTGDTVLRVPEYAQRDWTITKINGGTFGHDARVLTRHPGGTTNLDDLNVLAPSPTVE